MDSRQCFTFLLGVYLTSLGLTCATDYIPESIREDIKKVKEHFTIGDADKRLFGNPIFLKNLDNPESKNQIGIQKLLAHEILEVYINLLTTMMKQTKDPDVRVSIENLKGGIELLDQSFSRFKDLKKKLQALWAIKTDDLVIQRKALVELMSVYQKASMLAYKTTENQRKRRQVLRKRPF